MYIKCTQEDKHIRYVYLLHVHTIKQHFYARDKFVRNHQNKALYAIHDCCNFMRSSVLCMVTYGAIKITQYKFMRPALDSHNSHK